MRLYYKATLRGICRRHRQDYRDNQCVHADRLVMSFPTHHHMIGLVKCGSRWSMVIPPNEIALCSPRRLTYSVYCTAPLLVSAIFRWRKCDDSNWRMDSYWTALEYESIARHVFRCLSSNLNSSLMERMQSVVRHGAMLFPRNFSFFSSSVTHNKNNNTLSTIKQIATIYPPSYYNAFYY